MYHGRKERNTCETKVGFPFLEAHKSSKVMNLKEIRHKNDKLLIILNILSLNKGFFNGNSFLSEQKSYLAVQCSHTDTISLDHLTLNL